MPTHRYKFRGHKAALAAGLTAGGLSASILLASSAGAESSYRAGVDRCLASAPAGASAAECIDRLEPSLETVKSLAPPALPAVSAVPTPAVPTPAVPASASPASDAPAPPPAGIVTSGAEQAPFVAASSGWAASRNDVPRPSLPDVAQLQRQVLQEVEAAAEAVPPEYRRPTIVPVAVAEVSDEAAPAEEEAPPAPPVDDWMGAALARLRDCESGGDYGIHTGNGYYGAYQFSLRTWQSLGYGGYPHQADPAVQDEAAIALQARDGWGQWPSCSRQLGLG